MKKSSIIILSALGIVLLTVLACTIPITIVTTTEKAIEEEAEVEAVVEPTAAPVSVELVATATLAVTPAVAVSLDGAWTIWQGTSQKKLNLNFLQDGYDVVGNAATDDGHSLLFEGTISHDNNTVSGTWESTNGSKGNFAMYLQGTASTFAGNMGGGVPFCGNRMAAAMPNPCLQ